MEAQKRLQEMETVSLEFLPGEGSSCHTLADVGRMLVIHRRSLPPDLRSLRVHQRFCLAHGDLQTLESAYKPTLSWDRFITYFFDTADYQLAQRNWWLVLHQGAWTLKKRENDSSNEHHLVVIHAERDEAVIKREVTEALGRSHVDDLEQLCPNEFAVLRTERHTYHTSTGWCLYADSVELADDDHYLVGTLSIAPECDSFVDDQEEELPPVLDSLSVVSPVLSRVAEFIHGHLPDLAKTLRSKFVLPGPFYSGQGLNHQRTEHFDVEDEEEVEEEDYDYYDEDATVLAQPKSDDPEVREKEEEEEREFGGGSRRP